MDNKKKYISIKPNNDKIDYCLQCNFYIIRINGLLKKEECEKYCYYCKNPHIQNIYVNDAKIYFEPRTTNFIGSRKQNYSWTIMPNMDNHV